jgi:hypothetical protein
MNKQRLEWVMSGLNQHALTKTEDHFLQTVSADFDKNQALTEQQEERLENLYKQKSKLIPNKTSSNPSSQKESSTRKGKPWKPGARIMF